LIQEVIARFILLNPSARNRMRRDLRIGHVRSSFRVLRPWTEINEQIMRQAN
jgi:hypothetical protein